MGLSIGYIIMFLERREQKYSTLCYQFELYLCLFIHNFSTAKFQLITFNLISDLKVFKIKI